MNEQNKHPLVSVVMPVYNGERYLREAIDSILNQTYTNFEFIIINDGSTDKSEQIVLSYTDSRIRYLVNEKNLGICTALNKGLDASQGKYIARMDCDDISMPDRFQKQVHFLEKNTEVGIVGSDIIVFGDELDDQYFDFVHDKDGCKAGLIFNTCFAHPTVMFRRSILVENNLYYNVDYSGLEDFELWWRMSQYTELINIKEPLLRYRKHKEQITNNVTKKVSEKEIEFHKDIFLKFARLNDAELDALVSYCLNGGVNFDYDQYLHFYFASGKIIQSPLSNKTNSFHYAMQVTMSKALVYALSKSSLIKFSRPILYTKAYLKGIMPLDWFCKFMYHAFFKK